MDYGTASRDPSVGYDRQPTSWHQPVSRDPQGLQVPGSDLSRSLGMPPQPHSGDPRDFSTGDTAFDLRIPRTDIKPPLSYPLPGTNGGDIRGLDPSSFGMSSAAPYPGASGYGGPTSSTSPRLGGPPVLTAAANAILGTATQSPALLKAYYAAIGASPAPRRQRSEKKPIPDEQKDDKYYERRRRNNGAAKRSRDLRKRREDEIAIRASWLEKENSVLKAQAQHLREEAAALRQLVLERQRR